MFDKATSGDRSRNDHFSSCSVNAIMANVKQKRNRILDHFSHVRPAVKPRFCLESYKRMVERGDLCGNGFVEGSEECDCGHEEQCRNLEPNECCNWRTCKLNFGKQCSPSQGKLECFGSFSTMPTGMKR